MAGERLRIGFVGVGSMGQCAHLRNYAALDDCEVVAIAELRRQTGRAVARRYGVANVYDDHKQMLAAERLDAIVASQPFTRHGVLLGELVEASVPVFIEKPLAASVQAARGILEALDGSGAGIMVGYHKRSDPATIYAKAKIDELAASGEIGPMKYVRILMPAGDWIASGCDGRIDCGDDAGVLARDPPADDMDEEANEAYVGFVNYYIHQVNLMRHLLGGPWRVTYADPSGVVLAGRSDGGVACVIEMTPYRTTVEWQESAMVCFERGYVKLELPAPLASSRPGGVEVLLDPGDGATPRVTRPHLPWVGAMRQQAIHFIRFARGEAPPPCGAAEALEDLIVAREYIRLLRGV